MKPERPRWIGIGLLLAGVCAALPLFQSRYLPLSDLPEHLALIASIEHFRDPAFRTQEYFTFEGAFRTQYWLYHVVAAGLSWVLGGVERANLVLLGLVAFGSPYALAALLRALRRDERLAMIAAPLFWNRALAEGLVNYVASIPIALLALALAVHQARRPALGRGAALCLLAVVLFYLHLSSFALFLAGALLAALLVGRSLREATLVERLRAWATRAPYIFPTAALGLFFVATSTVTHPDRAEGEHAGVVRFSPKLALARALFAWMHDFWRSPVDDWLAIAAWVGVAMLLFADRRPTELRTERAARALAVLPALFYFFMPSQVGFAFVLDVRMAPFVGLGIPLLIGRRRGRLAWAGAALIAAATTLGAANGVHEMRAFEREEAAHFDQVLKNLPKGRRLLMLVFHRDSPRVHVTPFVHFGSYYRARYGGIAGFSFSELPHWPLRYRPERAPPKKAITFWDWNPCLFRNESDGPYYDFVLTRGDVEPFDAEPPGPRWDVIATARDWVLYQKSARPPVPHREDHGPCPREPRPAAP